MTSFDAAAQGYDAVMLLAAAMKQANAPSGEAVQQALENPNPVDGVIKRYDKPFSKQNHEALRAADLTLARWRDGKVGRLEDDIMKSLTAADLKR